MNRQTIETWLTDPTIKRLGLAIVCSALLHFFLLGKYHLLSLPSAGSHTQLIEARLVLNKPKATQPAKTANAEPSQVPAQKKLLKPKPAKPEKTAEPVLEKSEPTPSNDVDVTKPPVPDPQDEVAVKPVDEAISEPILAEEKTPIMQDEPEAEAPKATPYTFVETDFDVLLNEDKQRSGTAKITYKVMPNQSYDLTWQVKATGLLGMIYPNLVQTSQGTLTDTGLKPRIYLYQFGDKPDKTFRAEFGWSDKVVNLSSSKGQKTAEIADGTQDFLSFMYQFMFVPPLDHMQVNMTNGKKVGLYDYEFVGEETLTLKFATLKTYHIQHAKADSEDKTELWLATDNLYIPVKIRKTEKNGTVIEQVATNIKTETITQELPPP